MNVPHFTTKYCVFFNFLVEKNWVTIKYWNGVLAGLFLVTVGNKPLQRVKKQQNLHHQKKKV